MFDFLSLNFHTYRADMFDKVLKTLHQENTLKSILIILYQCEIEGFCLRAICLISFYFFCKFLSVKYRLYLPDNQTDI